jgi:2'-5' RNA ligase
MRLFVAVDLDEAVREAVGRVQRGAARVLDRDRALKWVDPSRMHLTLAFIGEVRDAPLAAAIVDSVSGALASRSFLVGFEGFGVFPPRGSPRVLWLGVSEGVDGLMALHEEVSARLRRAGVALEPRPFHPHLTLARWRHSDRPPRRSEAARALAADPGVLVARESVGHVTLYQSKLSPAGSTYVALARATLT